jgi:hypothetical protein
LGPKHQPDAGQRQEQRRRSRENVQWPGGGYFRRFPALGKAMNRYLALTLLLAGCTASGGMPDHPLVGTWQGEKTLTLKTEDYRYGSETGYWSAGRNEFRYKTESGTRESCNFSLTGRVLVMSGCRLAGRYTRTP